MVSPQGNVDWFGFWLKGEEDSDPAKAEQYARWGKLRKLQEQNESKFQQTNSAHPKRQLAFFNFTDNLRTLKRGRTQVLFPNPHQIKHLQSFLLRLPPTSPQLKPTT